MLFYFLADSTPRRIVVAIDGPAGAGKSTIAKRLAARLRLHLYRYGRDVPRGGIVGACGRTSASTICIAWNSLRIAAEIELAPGRISLNGEDVTDDIRTPEVSNGASKMAVIPGVRRAMVAKQREIGERTSVVMEGRDIGTVVFPHAEVKIFLDANPRERVRRRLQEVRAKGETITEAALAAQMQERDQRDSTRRTRRWRRRPTRSTWIRRADDRGGGGGDPQDRAAR